MERFVRRANIERYLRLLEGVSDEAQRRQIEKLLGEERQKQKEAGDLEMQARLNTRHSRSA